MCVERGGGIGQCSVGIVCVLDMDLVCVECVELWCGCVFFHPGVREPRVAWSGMPYAWNLAVSERSRRQVVGRLCVIFVVGSGFCFRRVGVGVRECILNDLIAEISEYVADEKRQRLRVLLGLGRRHMAWAPFWGGILIEVAYERTLTLDGVVRTEHLF